MAIQAPHARGQIWNIYVHCYRLRPVSLTIVHFQSHRHHLTILLPSLVPLLSSNLGCPVRHHSRTAKQQAMIRESSHDGNRRDDMWLLLYTGNTNGSSQQGRDGCEWKWAWVSGARERTFSGGKASTSGMTNTLASIELRSSPYRLLSSFIV